MGKISQSPLESLMELVSKAPWWVGVVSAIVSYFILHYYATTLSVPTTANPVEIGQVAAKQVFKTLAFFGQYILPLIFLGGSFISVIKRRHRSNLLESDRGSDST